MAKSKSFMYGAVILVCANLLVKLIGAGFKIPLTYFYQPKSVVNRILMKVLFRFTKQDIERKHLNMIREFAIEANNGNLINLPFKIKVLKEYDYIVVGNIKKKEVSGEYSFRSGKLKIDGYGIIRSTISKVLTEPKIHQHIIDADRLPTTAKWRFRKEGDIFSPFGMAGTKQLKEYFIDKKIPQRMRDYIPVLAVDNKILVIADVEIADELKVTENTRSYYKINYEKDLI